MLHLLTNTKTRLQLAPDKGLLLKTAAGISQTGGTADRFRDLTRSGLDQLHKGPPRKRTPRHLLLSEIGAVDLHTKRQDSRYGCVHILTGSANRETAD